MKFASGLNEKGSCSFPVYSSTDAYLLVLFYTIATVFQLHKDSPMMYEMRRRKPEPTFLSKSRDP